ncbi:MAG: SPOR domain-containing protein [Desulfobacterales bacterium]
MMHWLRHATGRLWVTLLLGAGSSLGVMSLLQPAIGAEAAPAVVAVWLSALFFAVGWAADRLALRRVRRLLHAGEGLAREGLSVEAEAVFHKGLALLDSFLVSPAARRRSLPALCARLARFYLARPGGRGSSEAFITRYLAEVPGDGEVAEQWVLDAEGRDSLSEGHQGLLARLAAVHPRNDQIQLALARSYLMQERTDFPALQCYRRVCGGEGPSPYEVCREVAALLQKAGRGDEWVRKLALRCPVTTPADGGPVVPPVVLPSQARRPETHFPTAGGTVEDGAFRMNAALDDAEEEEAEEPAALPGVRLELAEFWRRVERLAGGIRTAAASGLRRVTRGAASVRAVTWGRAAGAGLGVLVVAGMAWLWVSDADLFREPAGPAAAIPSDAGPAPMVTDRFTLQVAAYLKPEYAHKFVENLKSQGFDAYWTETASGGKTWYQVRIAHFPDRPSAREFGSRLKQKGVIEDFYVTNYSR